LIFKIKKWCIFAKNIAISFG
jgi:hypothetical protein